LVHAFVEMIARAVKEHTMKVILTWPPNLGLQGLWSRLRMGDGRRAVIGFIREHTPGDAKANCRPNCSAGKATSGGGRSEVMGKN
jgi:hypothetical protein